MPAAAIARTPTLSVRSLARRYGTREAVRDVSFDVTAGELLAVIGPNGAGKTTLLSMLAGVLAPSEGEISRPSDRGVGWVPQQPALYSKLSVTENLRFFARLEGLSEPDGAVARMLEQTGLGDRGQEQVGRLSGGNQQRLNIAIGLLCEPAVLLLDEPSASLDPRQRERLWEFIDGLVQRGTSIVFSTHNVFEAERYADRVLVLGDGELLFIGTPLDLARAVSSGDDPAPPPVTSGGDPAAPPVTSGGDPAAPPGAPPDFEAAFVRFLRARGH